MGGNEQEQDDRIVGGTNYYHPPPDPFYGGLKEAYLFDPFTETWEQLHP